MTSTRPLAINDSQSNNMPTSSVLRSKAMIAATAHQSYGMGTSADSSMTSKSHGRHFADLYASRKRM
jgi:hypothetical protein